MDYATDACLSPHRITNQLKLPSSVMDSPEMESIIKECNFIIIVYVQSSLSLENRFMCV